jgi:two-component system sensor histidine kinase HydH
MAAGVAHEIKNPLASIKGAVEIIGSAATPESDKREFQTIISKEIKRIDGTVKEFLEYARPRPAQLARLNLTSVLESTLRQVSAMSECQSVRFETKIDPDTTILGDADKLHQAILNLLLNAVQASRRESTVKVQLHGGMSAILTIQDHGKGIAPEHLSHIFEPFYTTKPSGTGLGLAIVSEIMREHHGKIEVSSTVSSGTTFTLTFPWPQEKS